MFGSWSVLSDLYHIPPYSVASGSWYPRFLVLFADYLSAFFVTYNSSVHTLCLCSAISSGILLLHTLPIMLTFTSYKSALQAAIAYNHLEYRTSILKCEFERETERFERRRVSYPCGQ